jgi:hypothetical protein
MPSITFKWMSLHIGLSSTSFSLFVHLALTDCPPRADGEEPEQPPQSGGKAKRLPREVKQKLAKVARLAAREGKVPDELVDRLMGILGHVMRLTTLKVKYSQLHYC